MHWILELLKYQNHETAHLIKNACYFEAQTNVAMFLTTTNFGQDILDTTIKSHFGWAIIRTCFVIIWWVCKSRSHLKDPKLEAFPYQLKSQRSLF